MSSPHYHTDGYRKPLKYRKRVAIHAGTCQMYIRREIPHWYVYEEVAVMSGGVQMYFWVRRDDSV